MGSADNHVGNPRGVRQGYPRARRRAADPARPQAGSRESEIRLQVLNAASDLVDRLTYDEVTIDAVARASGVSKSTLYRHWPSRRVLVLEAYTYKTNLVTHVEDTGDVGHDLYAYLVALSRCLDEGETASTVANLLAEAIRNAEFSRLYRQTLLSECRQGFRAILERGRGRRQIRDDVDLGMVIDAVYGAIHHRLVATGEPIEAPFLRHLNEFIILGCATRPYLESH
ncbi:TetR/AcrR family transcriptional regulator [Arthrobacter sp. AL08]|uniref:TetR/AcrR family transcriptional regulator n=1 Tax=unclassified Arthrobacter TaxID=235627 RepID=UPI00249C1A2A|nr:MULTISPECIES: TetR/AcrR family transcriptional regulator [unclassified Arthrobacter]MDI3243146.1 TetR/AcrR family transcriptional regulator [Arthrobacter sp. AL05]MDI3279156.1 TetR/AcrR family transcriptional regulator [Arthrobacter sp. AL08]